MAGLPWLLVVAVAGVAGPGSVAGQEEPEIPFVSTPMEVVHDILEIAGTEPGDTVYDLGSGDGRIPMVAARDYGAVGVGVELDSSLVALSRSLAREAGVEDRVRYVQGDLFDVELRSATVLALYLNSLFNLRLRPKILEQMRPGSKVVSHVFDMGQWPADTVARRLEFGAFIYVWTVPADVEGRWRIVPESGADFVATLDQKFRAFCSAGPADAAGVRVEGGVLEGERIRFSVAGLPDEGGSLDFNGAVDGATMRGRTEGGTGWTATRIERGDGSLERWEPGGGGRPPDGCATDRSN